MRKGVRLGHHHAAVDEGGGAIGVIDEHLDLVEPAGAGVAHAAGGDGLRRAENPVQCVVVVDHHVDDRTTGEIGAAEQRRPGRERLPARGEPRAGFPSSPLATRLRDLDVLRPEAQDVRDHEDAIGRLVGPHERLGIFEREGDRLLEEDVLASGKRSLGHLPVLRGGQADIDRLDAGVGENRLQIIRPTRADLARQGSPRSGLGA